MLRNPKNTRIFWLVLVLAMAASVLWLTAAEAQNRRKPSKKAKPAAKKTVKATPPQQTPTPTPPPSVRPRRTNNAPTPTPTPAGNPDEIQDPPPLLIPENPKATPTPEVTDDPPPPVPTPQDTPQTLNDDEVVRIEVDLTNVLFTAVDKNRRFVTNLTQNDFRVYEDGRPQEVFTFTRQTDLPLSLALLIDTSVSQERTLPDEKDAATNFVNAVIRPNKKDEVAVVAFTGEATLEQGMTSNLARARRAIEGVRIEGPPGYGGGGVVVPGSPPISPNGRAGSTAIWDAIHVTAEEVMGETSDKTRRAIILLTDGVDTSSRYKREEAIDRAVKAEVVVYCIGIGDDFWSGVDEGTLKKVAEKTGGRAFFPRSEADLRQAFAQIQDELRSQYLVAYSSTNKVRDGSYRQVRLEITNPELVKEKMRLTYRQGYFAKK